MQTIQVRTTQNVFIHYPVASVGDRILAHLLDQIIKIICALAIGLVFYNMEIEREWIWILIIGIPWIFYTVLFEIYMNGQTPGKRALNIKVIRVNGTPATIGDYILRWIFSIIDFGILSGAIAVIIIAAGGKGQRLGDLVAGTTVVKLIDQKEITANDVFVTADSAYEPTFSQAIQLSEKDIEIIQRALEVNRDQGNPQPMLAVAEKLKVQLGIQTDLPPVKFLYVLIKDFNHLTSDGPAR
jgi:uncharacterized RDD family membrane protein YckC